jgi:hypothetical protein
MKKILNEIINLIILIEYFINLFNLMRGHPKAIAQH